MEHVKLISMTAVLTVLIWAAADSLVNESVSVPITLKTVSGGGNADVLVSPAADSESFELQVTGPRKAIARIQELAHITIRLTIPELPTGVRRVDVPPEEVEKPFVSDFRWIIEDLHRLDVPLLSVTLIGRVPSRAARIAGDDLENPGRLFKIGFHTPETAAGEGGDPGFCIDLVHFFYLLLRALPRHGYQHKKERRYIDKNSFHIILPEFGFRS